MVRTYEDHGKDLKVTTDVVIVGSGCGGAVLAHYLSEAGYDVVVCEEGSHYTVADYGPMKPTEAFKEMYRDYGGSLTMSLKESPSIAIQQGRCVGGSSVINGGVCFRTPDFIIDHWRKDLGLTEFTHKELDEAFTEVEKINHIVKMPKVLNNAGVKKIIKVAHDRKYKCDQIERNVKDCDGCNKCIMGCPHDAKQSVLITYLQEAQKNGAMILANCKVDKIKYHRDIATGVTGHIIHPLSNRKMYKVKIKAKLVIMAASALHSPYLLQKSGLGKTSGQLGHNLSLHPASRTYGIFDEDLHSWKGAFQTFAIEEFRKKHTHLINLFLSPNMLSGTMPGIGRHGYEVMNEMSKLSLMGVMLSDSSRGRVIGTRFGPVTYYTMSAEDKATFIDGLKIVGDMYFEAGAKKVYLPFYHNAQFNSRDELRKLDASKVPSYTFEVTSAHPMGTCKIGHDPKHSVLDPYHRLHELKNLYVTDSSAVPSSIAVNPQVTIMGLATRASWYLLDKKDWKGL